jgi:hypothetical protein
MRPHDTAAVPGVSQRLVLSVGSSSIKYMFESGVEPQNPNQRPHSTPLRFRGDQQRRRGLGTPDDVFPGQADEGVAKV